MLDELINEPFLGFQPEALRFLKLLKNPKNNNKLWFDKNRTKYETYLKQPMKDLIDSLAIEINKIDRNIIVSYKSIFRINRDVRFSKNKAPYKTNYSAAFAFGKIKQAEIPQFYFHFTSDEFLFASGQYSTDADYLKKIRESIFRNFNDYKKIISEKNFVRAYGEVHGESLTKLPKGYDNTGSVKASSELVKALKMKQFYVYKTYKPEIILNEKVIDVILDNISLSYDFTKFLDNAIK